MTRRHWGLALGFALVGGVTLWWTSRRIGELRVGEIQRTQDQGIDVLEAPVYRGRTRAGTLVAVYAGLDRYVPEVVQNPSGLEVDSMAPGAKVVVNGSFFTPENKPTGLLVSNGEVLHPFIGHGGPAGSGVLTVDHHINLHRRDSFEPGAETRFAIQAGPRLIEPGGGPGIYRDDGQRASRTVIGESEDGRLALVVVHTEPGLGPTLFELVALLKGSVLGPGLRLRAALNLDGGNSSGARVALKDLNVHLGSGVTVPYALALRERLP
ncbi:MAG: phosphodiester glycosidase family protein [Myxococcota bacterium]